MPNWKELTEEELIFKPEARIEYKRYCADCHNQDPPVDTPAGTAFTTPNALPENGRMYDGLCASCKADRERKAREHKYLGDTMK